jgi:sterol desaturase/sphingolipid hydroxylase (fatty acid hydroxylase superfamily)
VLPATLGALVLAGLCAALLVPLEALFPRTGGRRGLRTAALCIGLLVVNTLAMRALGEPVLRQLAEWVGPLGAPSPARLLAAFLLGDFAGYGLHRAMHRVPLLWRLHRVHHAPVELSWFEAWRQHPLDFVLHGLVIGLPSAVLGASLSDVVLLVVARKVWTAFLHADVRFRFGPLEWLLATPAFHRVHHSSDPADYDRNFSGTLPVWDLLFGTWRAPPSAQPSSIANVAIRSDAIAGSLAAIGRSAPPA